MAGCHHQDYNCVVKNFLHLVTFFLPSLLLPFLLNYTFPIKLHMVELIETFCGFMYVRQFFCFQPKNFKFNDNHFPFKVKQRFNG